MISRLSSQSGSLSVVGTPHLATPQDLAAAPKTFDTADVSSQRLRDVDHTPPSRNQEAALLHTVHKDNVDSGSDAEVSGHEWTGGSLEGAHRSSL